MVTIRSAPADAGMSAFEVVDTPERLAQTYPIVADVRELLPVGSYRVRGIRFRNVAELDAFRERHPELTFTVQT
jgi:hypothetical protein